MCPKHAQNCAKSAQKRQNSARGLVPPIYPYTLRWFRVGTFVEIKKQHTQIQVMIGPLNPNL